MDKHTAHQCIALGTLSAKSNTRGAYMQFSERRLYLRDWKRERDAAIAGVDVIRNYNQFVKLDRVTDIANELQGIVPDYFDRLRGLRPGNPADLAIAIMQRCNEVDRIVDDADSRLEEGEDQ